MSKKSKKIDEQYLKDDIQELSRNPFKAEELQEHTIPEEGLKPLPVDPKDYTEAGIDPYEEVTILQKEEIEAHEFEGDNVKVHLAVLDQWLKDAYRTKKLNVSTEKVDGKFVRLIIFSE